MAQSPNDRWLLALAGGGTAWLADRATGSSAIHQLNIRSVCDAAFSADGKRFAAATWPGIVKVWDTATLQEVESFRSASASVAFSPDDKRFAIGGEGKKTVNLWDRENRLGLVSLESGGSVFWRTEFSQDGNVLAALSRSGDLHLWRAPSWAEIEAVEAKEVKQGQAQ